MQGVLQSLSTKATRNSTMKNYFTVWRIFNKFVIRLDIIPTTWEEKLTLFCAYLVDRVNQSSTIRSYISAVKAVLRWDGYTIDEGKLQLGALIQACRLINDVVFTRLPIQLGLLEMILFEVSRIFENQPYLEKMFKALFSLAYYGLFRVGELTLSDHSIKAKNVHCGENKYKIKVYLYSSKTHGPESYPQKVKIMARDSYHNTQCGSRRRSHLNFCPFQLLRDYIGSAWQIH